jgi:hypothetical protein
VNFIKVESDQKLRGGYYTPPDLAGFLARWVAEIKPRSVLEPSCGDGAFFPLSHLPADLQRPNSPALNWKPVKRQRRARVHAS